MNILIDKRIYNSPHIERITLDNEISLALESDPPTYESGNSSTVPEYFNNDPFRSDIIS
ncbi:MAG TPA: hypothetical protein VFK73_07395 [Paludibacter sp.]|nr:hypothetical protein [Paludibacter sp.]